MTEVVSTEGTVAIPQAPMNNTEGLEDFDIARDAVMPRIGIVHKKGMFKDNLSGTEFPTLRCVMLGLVKQRILWDTVIGNDDKPMCKSPDFHTGFPTVVGNNGKTYPWEKSGFDPANFPVNTEGFVPLPCESCQLKEWGSHPDGKKPFCSEMHTFPLMYDPTGEAGDDISSWTPGLLSVQKTGIKPSKTYLTSFIRARTPTYTAITEITLEQVSRGTTDYSVPVFKRVGNVDETFFPALSQTYRSSREFVTSHPTSRDDDVPAVTAGNNEWTEQQAAAPVAAPVEVLPTETVAPVAPPAAPVAPVAAAPVAPVVQAAPAAPTLTPPAAPVAPVAQVALQAPPVAPVAPAAPVAEPVAPVAEAPVAAPVAAPATTDSDLPF